MKKVKKKKEILEFFGIKESFFKTTELKGKDIGRFVDRKETLQDLKIAVDFNQNCAVIGDTGTGKSSLLLKFQQEIKDTYYTDYLYLSMDARTDKDIKEELFQYALSSLLTQIIANDDLLKQYDPVDIYLETKRLDHTISVEKFEKKKVEITPEIEANFSKLFNISFLPIKLKAKLVGKIGKETQKKETKTYDKHTEISLKKTINSLTERLPEPIILFIDEMDRIIKTITKTNDWTKEFIKILQFCTEIMTNDNLIFVFALQPEMYEIFVKADRGEGDDTILRYVPTFKKIDGFNMDFAAEAVKESLKFVGYKGTVEDLFEAEVLEIVLSVVKFNPRQFMLKLTHLVGLAYKKNQPRVTKDILKEFLFKKFGETGPEEWRKRFK